jgi:hypothetical protein
MLIIFGLASLDLIQWSTIGRVYMVIINKIVWIKQDLTHWVWGLTTHLHYAPLNTSQSQNGRQSKQPSVVLSLS